MGRRKKKKSLKAEVWNKSNGYISHANDELTHKGFRYYNITVNNTLLDKFGGE